MTFDRILSRVRFPGTGEAGWLGIRDGRIAGRGAGEPPSGGERIDGEGRIVHPGLVDSHAHLIGYALHRHAGIDLSTPTKEEGLARIRSVAERLSDGAWLRGRGWDPNRWGGWPDRRDLDPATGNRPAVFPAHDGHSAWLNSAALAALGITSDTPDPSGGGIDRDEHGKPTGILREAAGDDARDRIPPLPEAEVVAAVREGAAELHRFGLTGVHECSYEFFRYRAMLVDGGLPLRILAHLGPKEIDRCGEEGVRAGWEKGLLRLGAVKVYADGALGSRSAWMLDDYADRPGHRGMRVFSDGELETTGRAAAPLGLGLAIHAIGDGAIRASLDVITRLRPLAPDALFRIEHAQCIHPDDLPRFRALGVVACVQPVHLFTDIEPAGIGWGEERCRRTFPVRSLLDAGVSVALGSDAPIETFDPWAGLHAAVTRTRRDGTPSGGWIPEERIGVSEGLAGYTTGAAVAAGTSGEGGLDTGTHADLILLPEDPRTLPSERLLDLRPSLTMIAGAVVWRGGG